MAALIAVTIRLENSEIACLKRFSHFCSTTFGTNIKSFFPLSHIDGQNLVVLKIRKADMAGPITLHFRIFRNIGIIWRFCICLFFFLIFILNRLSLNRSEPPRLNHRMQFYRRMAIRTYCIFFHLITKPITFRADNNVFPIILTREVVFRLIILISLWSRI